MSEIYIFLSEVHDSEVDTLAMFSDGHTEFYELGDVTALVTGSICIVDRDGYCCFLHVKLVFSYVGTIDGAPGAAAVKQGFRA